MAYAHNPEEERLRYEGEGVGEGEGKRGGDVDTLMTVLTVLGGGGGGGGGGSSGGSSSSSSSSSSGPSTAATTPTAAEVRGAMAWYAVHGTSLRNSNQLVSGDNKGVASWLAETALRNAAATSSGGSGGDGGKYAIATFVESL